MTAGDRLLERMRTNPRDWRIEDVAAICRAHGVECAPPHKESYYKIKHDRMPEILTVPAHRPIKPVYVRELVKFIDRVREKAA